MSKETFTGCTSANFHEAARSEYLAHYVFSSFGTSVPVPRQEDTGIDLICTLGERDGQRLWPIASYCVQVKSNYSPWVFADTRSIEWFVKNPLPIFLCVVDKKKATINIYQTNPRFHVWVDGCNLERLEVIPVENSNGEVQIYDSYEEQDHNKQKYSLSAPIACFEISRILDESFHSNIRKLLKVWVESDRENIFRIQSNLPKLSTPIHYTTNEPRVEGNLQIWRSSVSKSEHDEVLKSFVETAKWLSAYYYECEHWQEFALIQMLLRRMDKLEYVEDYNEYRPLEYYIFSELRKQFPSEQMSSNDKYYAGLDGLNAKIKDVVSKTISRAKKKQKSDEDKCISPSINKFGEGV